MNTNANSESDALNSDRLVPWPEISHLVLMSLPKQSDKNAQSKSYISVLILDDNLMLRTNKGNSLHLNYSLNQNVIKSFVVISTWFTLAAYMAMHLNVGTSLVSL